MQQERLVVVHQRRITGKSAGWRRINLNDARPLGVLTSLFPCRQRSSQIFAFLQEPCGAPVGLSQFCGVRIVAFTQRGRSGAVEGWQRQYDSIRDRVKWRYDRLARANLHRDAMIYFLDVTTACTTFWPRKCCRSYCSGGEQSMNAVSARTPSALLFAPSERPSPRSVGPAPGRCDIR